MLFEDFLSRSWNFDDSKPYNARGFRTVIWIDYGSEWSNTVASGWRMSLRQWNFVVAGLIVVNGQWWATFVMRETLIVLTHSFVWTERLFNNYKMFQLYTSPISRKMWLFPRRRVWKLAGMSSDNTKCVHACFRDHIRRQIGLVCFCGILTYNGLKSEKAYSKLVAV